MGSFPTVSLLAAGIDNIIVGLVSSSRSEKDELRGTKDGKEQDESPRRESDWIRLCQWLQVFMETYKELGRMVQGGL